VSCIDELIPDNKESTLKKGLNWNIRLKILDINRLSKLNISMMEWRFVIFVLVRIHSPETARNSFSVESRTTQTSC
jgi:hypothetical protein